MAPFVRPLLAVAQTTLTSPVTGEAYPFLGLYATVDLPKGSFLGFYNGTFREIAKRDTTRDGYVFATSNERITPRKTKGRVDPARYPLAMLNEPPPGTTANVTAVEFVTAQHVIPQLPPRTKIAAIGFFTCRFVAAGDELFVHYGAFYDRRKYENPHHLPADQLVGAPCTLLKKEREHPTDMAAMFGLSHARVDDECFVVYDA